MEYNLKQVYTILKIFNFVESNAKDFMYLSSFPMKDKTKIKKSAEKTIQAIEEYKKLPVEIRQELEKDKNNYVSQIDYLEKLCKNAVELKK